MLLNFIKFYGKRNFSKSNIGKNIEKSKLNESAPTSSTASVSSSGMTTDFIPNEWEKKILVWSGKYKFKDIPPKISFATLDNAKSRLRIRLSNFLMVCTLFMCGYYIWVGKNNQKKGDTFIHREMSKRNSLQKSE